MRESCEISKNRLMLPCSQFQMRAEDPAAPSTDNTSDSLQLKTLTVNDVLNRPPSASVPVLRVVRIGVPKCQSDEY